MWDVRGTGRGGRRPDRMTGHQHAVTFCVIVFAGTVTMPDGVMLRLTSTGSGHPLVMCHHGGPGLRDYLDPLARAVRAGPRPRPPAHDQLQLNGMMARLRRYAIRTRPPYAAVERRTAVTGPVTPRCENSQGRSRRTRRQAGPNGSHEGRAARGPCHGYGPVNGANFRRSAA